jgi:hypothetical protein
LLRSDGSTVTQVIHSVRPPMGDPSLPVSYDQGTRTSSVRRFLGALAIRTTHNYNIGEDSITGIDWASSNTSTPSNIEGVTVPLLIMPNTCHYFMVPDEIIFQHARSVDKEIVFVEGAAHGITPCRPEFGDTVKRAFDYIDGWLSQPGRF